MPDSAHASDNPAPPNGAFLWDMAGTLIAYDGITGRPGAIPGGEEFLPELGKLFRLFVTTGDETDNARTMLRGFELLRHFEDVFGNLYTPLGKPYGQILRQVGCAPERSLAIGDRLRSDLPADTPDVVLFLVNQRDEIINAGTVRFLVDKLRELGDTFPAAFRALAATGTPDPEAVGELMGGRVAQAWRVKAGPRLRLFEYQHSLLDGGRLVIEI